jgi:hypothetical protein
MEQLVNDILQGLDRLTTGIGLIQLLTLLAIILVAVALGRWLRASDAMQRVDGQTGLRYRLLEALYIVAPHLLALILAAASRFPVCPETEAHLAGHQHFADRPAADGAAGGVRVPRLRSARAHQGWGNTISLLIWLPYHCTCWAGSSRWSRRWTAPACRRRRASASGRLLKVLFASACSCWQRYGWRAGSNAV